MQVQNTDRWIYIYISIDTERSTCGANFNLRAICMTNKNNTCCQKSNYEKN